MKKQGLSDNCAIGKKCLINSYEIAQLGSGSQKKKNHTVVPHSSTLRQQYAGQFKARQFWATHRSG